MEILQGFKGDSIEHHEIGSASMFCDARNRIDTYGEVGVLAGPGKP